MRHYTKQAEIGFAEKNSVRIIRGIFNIQALFFIFNPIQVLPPYAITNPNKALYGIFNRWRGW